MMENNWIRGKVPDYDGYYLCFVAKKQECGTIWGYCKVIQCIRALWVLEAGELVFYWQHLPDSPSIPGNVLDVTKTGGNGDAFTAGAKRGYEMACDENAKLKSALQEMIDEFYYVVKSEDDSRVRAIELLENLKTNPNGK